MTEQEIVNDIEDLLIKLLKRGTMDNHEIAQEIYNQIINKALQDAYSEGYVDGELDVRKNSDD